MGILGTDLNKKEFDITSKIGKHLFYDPIIQLLEYILQRNSYPCTKRDMVKNKSSYHYTQQKEPRKILISHQQDSG